MRLFFADTTALCAATKRLRPSRRFTGRHVCNVAALECGLNIARSAERIVSVMWGKCPTLLCFVMSVVVVVCTSTVSANTKSECDHNIFVEGDKQGQGVFLLVVVFS